VAFPSILTTATRRNTSSTTTHPTPTLTPADVSVGDLVLWLFVFQGTPTVTWPSSVSNMTAPSVLGTWSFAGTTVVSIAYTQVTATASSYSFSVTTNATATSAAQAYHIRGWQDVYVSSMATGNSTTPDPPALTPAGGQADYLWIPVGAWQAESATPSGPANYTDLIWVTSADTNNPRRVIATARRFLNAATENPGPFSTGGTTGRNWGAVTLAVRGSSGTILTIAPATTTATPLTPSRRKHRAVNPAAPQAAAVTPGRYKRRAVGSVTAQATAATPVRRKRRNLDTAAAQAEALPLVRRQNVLIGTATTQATATSLNRRKLLAVDAAAAQSATVTPAQRKLQSVDAAAAQATAMTLGQRQYLLIDAAAIQATATALDGHKLRVIDVAAVQTVAVPLDQRKSSQMIAARVVAEAHWLNETALPPPPDTDGLDPVLLATRGVVRLKKGVIA
jgi:hypothetical protein